MHDFGQQLNLNLDSTRAILNRKSVFIPYRCKHEVGLFFSARFADQFLKKIRE